MTSSSPESGSQAVLRGTSAGHATTARFDVDLSGGAPAPGETVEHARAAARTAGYADGWAQGQQAARVSARAAADQAAAAQRAATATAQAALEQAVAAVGQAAVSLDRREALSLAGLEDAILTAAVTVAEALIGYELSRDEDRGLAAVRRAMALVPDGGPVTVRLHPDDHLTLAGADGSAYEFEGRPVILRADARLAPGDAVAEYAATTVDATIGAALARVREVLAR